MAIAIGRYRFRGDLIKKSDTPNSNSDSILNQAWTVVATVWMEIMPVSGTMYLTNRNINSETTHRAQIRYNPVYEDGGKIDHVRHDNRLFKVISTKVKSERNRFIEFELKELGASSSYNIV